VNRGAGKRNSGTRKEKEYPQGEKTSPKTWAFRMANNRHWGAVVFGESRVEWGSWEKSPKKKIGQVNRN